MSDEEKALELFTKEWANRRAGEWICIDDENGVIYPRPAFYEWFAAALREARREGAQAMQKRAAKACREIAVGSVRAVGAVTEVAVVADKCSNAIRSLDPAEVVR